jgi:glucose/arabinose dehydrogenase
MILILSAVLMALWGAMIALGIALVVKRRWLLGALLIVEGALAMAVQVALSTIPVGIGEPLLRIPRNEFWIAAGIGAAAFVVTLVLLLARRDAAATAFKHKGAAIALPLIVPLLAAGALWGASQLSIPERERERDAGKRSIELPAGFSANIYAQGIPDNPTTMAFAPGGRLYIADINGTIWHGDEIAGEHTLGPLTKFADGFNLLTGLAWRDGELYVSSAGKVEALRDTNDDGVADSRRTLADNLPALILMPHSNNSLTFGPDGRLYFGVGSTADGGKETRQYASSILSVSPDGGDVRVFATGFGNPFEVAFNQAGDLFSGDNQGLASPDGAPPPDELNYIVPGGEYDDLDLNNANAREPIVQFPAHATPTGLTFYTGNTYPPDYLDNAFAALWTRGEVARIVLSKTPQGDYVASPSVWGSGFLYPIDVVNGPDGNLYIADFGTSVIYRVTYDAQ